MAVWASDKKKQREAEEKKRIEESARELKERAKARGGKCIPTVGCGKELTTPFKQDWNEREYAISGLCQDCQDKFFK